MATLPRLRSRARLAAMLSGAAAATLLALMPLPADAVVTCDRVAAAGGSDAAAGTATAPYATVAKLAGSLSPGQVGCIRGTVAGNVWISGDGITLTSEPGQRGTIKGQVVIDPEASGVALRDLDVDLTGVGRPGVIVLGDDATLAGNDITNNHTQYMCVLIGAKNHDSGARADRLRIEGNRIHDCGVSDNHQHGVYVEHALDTRIVGNFIHDNADRAIQLYPDAQRTVITGNVIDGNGEGIIFSGNGGVSSNDTVVRGNVITWPRLRAAIESWYPSGTPAGRNNVVEFNCLYGRDRMIDDTNGGFVARDNVFEDPQYVDRAAHDYRLRDGSPCAALLAAGRAEADVYPAPPPGSDTTDEPETEPLPEPTPPELPPTESEPAPALPNGKPKPGKPGRVKTLSAASRSSRVRLTVRRRPGRTYIVRVRLRDRALASVRTLLEVRAGRRSWRAIAAPRLVPGRTYQTRVRLPRGVSRLRARARVVDDAGSAVARLAARRRA